MPSWGQRGRKLSEHSTRHLVGWIVLCPVIGAAMIVVAAVHVRNHWDEFTATDWLFQFGWMVVVGVVLAVGPPAVAVKELRRRKGDVSGRG